MIRFAFLLWPLFLVTTLPCQAEPLPKPVANMIEKAIKSGDKAKIKAVVEVAKEANPNSIAEIDAQVAALKDEAEKAHAAQLRQRGFFEAWSGEGQVGMSSSRGNSSNLSVALGMKMAHESLHWRHKFALAVDYQKSEGVKTANKYQATYEADYKISERFFTTGLAEWEKDRFAGYSSRITLSPGFGYDLVKTPNVTWQISGGPAFRQTRLITGEIERKGSAHAATEFTWDIFDYLTFTESAAAFMNGGNKTYLSVAGLTGKINSSLSARISYDYKYESEPPLGLGKTDATSRFTLVYGF